MPVIPYLWVDVFAPEALCGNQLCVFPSADELSLPLMKKIARELNHSETTFLQRSNLAGTDSRIRILIPTPGSAEEIPFAGHPILGGACAIALGRALESTVAFETGIGTIAVKVTPIRTGVWEAEMAQPIPRLVRTLAISPELAQALGLSPADFRPGLPVEAVDNGMQTVLIPLTDLSALERAVPDLTMLQGLLGRDGLCTMIFAPGGREPNSDVSCRVFSPFDLVGEDPATGSANGPMAEYLVRHGVLAGPKVRSEQGDNLGRPSRLSMEIERAGGITTKVQVGGTVRLIGKGEFQLD